MPAVPAGGKTPVFHHRMLVAWGMTPSLPRESLFLLFHARGRGVEYSIGCEFPFREFDGVCVEVFDDFHCRTIFRKARFGLV